MAKRLEQLNKKAQSLPLCPGVYLMKDADGKVIYVGKSRKLKNRVSSYFTGTQKHPKTARMVARVADFDYILCDGEMEALALENTLIKKYAPHYNIRLKDAKSYPYIKVTPPPYSRLIVTRERRSDGGRYYGPYSSVAAAHAVTDTLNKIFSLATCRRRFPRDIGRERPCLYARMGRCVAPCSGEVSEEAYAALIRGAEGVLRGQIKDTEAHLVRLMTEAAEEERYEAAARYRDAITALHRLCDKQKVVGDEKEDRDVLALYEDDLCGVLAVLSVREGKLQGKHEFLFGAAAMAEEENAAASVLSYYDGGSDLPREILLAFPLPEEEYEVLSRYLSEMAGHRVRVVTPKRGALRELCEMALTNARQRAERYRAECAREDATMTRLATLLGLESTPQRVEAYDISEIGREYITAGMAVTNGTRFKSSDYRTFRIKTLSGVDDCGAMREALARRLAHIGDGSASLGEAPDLILLDGGVGQVHAGKAVLGELGLSIPLFGMVKDDYHKTRALTDGERELSIANEGSVYVYIYRLQEEVHRISVRSVMGAKGKSLRRSTLEDIHGIGPAKAKKILRLMKLSALREASVSEMTAAGIPPRDAERIYGHFHKEDAQA